MRASGMRWEGKRLGHGGLSQEALRSAKGRRVNSGMGEGKDEQDACERERGPGEGKGTDFERAPSSSFSVSTRPWERMMPCAMAQRGKPPDSSSNRNRS